MRENIWRRGCGRVRERGGLSETQNTTVALDFAMVYCEPALPGL